MNLKEIKALYRFLRNTDIVELESEDGEGRLKIKRRFPSEPHGEGRKAATLDVVPETASAASGGDVAKSEPSKNIKSVNSPMVGTFYGAPAPESDSYVDVGSRVSRGQTLCIIEAMKLMNEVECEFNGVITSILVENGQPVEYGEPLFYVEVS